MPKKKNSDPVKMQKKMNRHERRILGFNIQLSAYVRLIRKVGTIPVLDSNMVNFLQALLDQLLKITEFDTFLEESLLERNLQDREVSFSLACTFCGQTGFASGLSLIGHLLGDRHDEILPVRKRNRFQQIRVPMLQDLVTFLEREKHILGRHRFRETLLEPLVDFYFLTKAFLKMTSHYLVALEKLERQPSMTVGRGVNELLGHVVNLIEKAQCIESVPHYNTLLFQYSIYSVAYTFSNNVFNDIRVLLTYFSNLPGQTSQIQGNIFSVSRPPPPGDSIPTQMFTGQNLHIRTNIQAPTPPSVGPQSIVMGQITRAEIPPFLSHPPPRMVQFQQPMRFLLQPSPPQVPMSAFPSPQQHRLMLFHPSTSPSAPSPSFQQHGPFSNGFLPQMLPSPVQPSLPPLNEAGTADHPIFNEYLKRFLQDPRLEDLIETGNILCHFATASLIPSELVQALKRTLPEAQLTVKCFGAKVSGVGYETDNVNLFVDDGTYPKTQKSIEVLFTALLEFFSARHEDWVLQNSNICGLWTHLKVKNSCENVYCQISFDSELYCANSRLIRYFTAHYPSCQKLCYFIQEFAKLSELNFERNVIVVLAIFYLQIENALPTVHQLRHNLSNNPNNTHWPSDFNPLPPANLNLKPLDSDIRRIARGFFHFYGHKLSFPDYVICPYDGQAINRSDFIPAHEWRLSQPRYRTYLQASSSGQQQQPERLDVRTPMCIQDLLVLKTNIAGKISADECNKFVRLCRMADEFYANNAL